MGMDAIISLPGLATTAITGTLTLTKLGTSPQVATFPAADIEVQGTREIVQSNWTARNHGAYTAIATATATDPSTPAAGHEFTTIVRNGTITIGGTAYSTPGAAVTRLWHSGSWTNYVYPHLDGAWTWTAAQTIDRGTGALPAPTNAGNILLTLAGGAGTNNLIESFGFGGSIGLSLRPRISGGTRAALSAVPDGQSFFDISTSGYDGTAWQTNNGLARILADGLWTGSNRGVYYLWSGTPNGSTTAAEWMRLQNGNLGIGVTPTAGNGLLQLASGTTRANGIWMGDFPIFRAATGVLAIGDGTTAASTQTTVGAAGGASALPATPTGYIRISISGTIRKIPFYADS